MTVVRLAVGLFRTYAGTGHAVLPLLLRVSWRLPAIIEHAFYPDPMGDRERDQALVSTIQTIATRTWEPPTGQERDTVLARLHDIAGDRTDLLTQATGIMFGLRPPDENDPSHRKYSAGAELLLEVAGVGVDDPRVQRWVPVGAERRTRWRRPETLTGWGV